MRRRLSVGLPRTLHEPDLSNAHKRAIERALRWAWVEVCRRWPKVVAKGKEEAITAKLQLLLNLHADDNRRCAPGIRSFETVGRGAKVVSADGRIEKMPDLVFRPPAPRTVRNRSEWGYFIECKIVGGSKTVALYCKQGVARFCSGEYCARMPSGGLVAYVRDGTRPFVALDPHLSRAYSTNKHTDRPGSGVSDSVHGRGALPKPCVDITLTHLWLDA